MLAVVVQVHSGFPVTVKLSILLRSAIAGLSHVIVTSELPASAWIFVGGGYWIVSSRTTIPWDHEFPRVVLSNPSRYPPAIFGIISCGICQLNSSVDNC